jgi:hypothetical protein
MALVIRLLLGIEALYDQGQYPPALAVLKETTPFDPAIIWL